MAVVAPLPPHDDRWKGDNDRHTIQLSDEITATEERCNRMYVLTRRVLGKQPEIPIDASRYAALSEAVGVQRAALEIEEKFDLVVANYEELERETLTLTLTHAVRNDFTWASMSSDRLLLGRRLVNLLTTCRLYVDQVVHSVGRSPTPIGCTRKQAEEVFKDQYDRNLAYRIMDALRNHVQHRSLAIAGITYGCKRVRAEATQPLVRFTLSLTLDLEALREDERFKKPTLEELENLPQKQQDLFLFVRQYVQSLGRAQERLRELLAAAVKRADADVQSALTEWKTVSDTSIGLAAVKRHDGSRSEEHFAMSGNLREKREELVASNRSLANLASRFVSGARPRDAYPPWIKR